jgi:hypothetical protein
LATITSTVEAAFSPEEEYSIASDTAKDGEPLDVVEKNTLFEESIGLKAKATIKTIDSAAKMISDAVSKARATDLILFWPKEVKTTSPLVATKTDFGPIVLAFDFFIAHNPRYVSKH